MNFACPPQFQLAGTVEGHLTECERGNMPLLAFTDENFEEEVLKSDLPVLIDFWAPWCGPCQPMGQIIKEIAKDYEGKPIKIGKLDIDENAKTAGKYGILSIPTVAVFKEGKIADQVIGLCPKADIKEMLDKVMG